MSSDFPEKLPAKLKAIRERYDLTLAEPLKSLYAATIEAYESGAADLPLAVLFAYAKLRAFRLRASLNAHAKKVEFPAG